MNSCPQDLVPDYYGKTLSSEEMETVRRHAVVCPECQTTLEILAAIETPVPEPPAAFWSSLPGKVTEEARFRRRWTLAPAWAGGAAAAVVIIVLFAVLKPLPEVPVNGASEPYEPYERPAFVSLGLEEELWSISGSEVAFIDRSYDEEIDFPLDQDAWNLSESFLGKELLEVMDEETIRVFEELIDEMNPNNLERG